MDQIFDSIQVRDPNEVSGFWLQFDAALVTMAIWEVNQQMEVLIPALNLEPVWVSQALMRTLPSPASPGICPCLLHYSSGGLPSTPFKGSQVSPHFLKEGFSCSTARPIPLTASTQGSRCCSFTVMIYTSFPSSRNVYPVRLVNRVILAGIRTLKKIIFKTDATSITS